MASKNLTTYIHSFMGTLRGGKSAFIAQSYHYCCGCMCTCCEYHLKSTNINKILTPGAHKQKGYGTCLVCVCVCVCV